MERLRGRAGVAQRNRIRQRDCGMCQRCLRAGIPKLGSEVDHIVALVNGGSNDDDNLELVCDDCHGVKTDEDLRRKPRHGCDARGLPTSANHPWNR